MAGVPPKDKCAEFAQVLTYSTSLRATGRALRMPYSSVVLWRDMIPIWYPDIEMPPRNRTPGAKGRREVTMKDGMVFVGGDGHYWPGQEPPTAHRALIHFLRKFKKEKKIVIINGDTFDFPRISRHPPQGWTRMPEPQEEIEACQERMGEIKVAAGKAPCYWPEGNHDARFETRLAMLAPEFAKVKGMRLVDHFPDWEPCWSVFVNNHPGGLVVKHRFRGGIHATWNNTIYSGRNIVTNHLHSQNVRPFTDYNGTRYGVDTGCIADPWSDQFQYIEDNPRNWVAGFAILTFKNGVMLPPELVTVIEDGVVFFRGELIEV